MNFVRGWTAVLGALAAMLWASSASAALIPSQGELVHVGTSITGPCQVDTPPWPDTSNWGPDQNGTPYNGTYKYTDFFIVQDGQLKPAGELDSVGWGEGDTIRPDTDPISGAEYCDFWVNHGNRVTEQPVHARGIWVMRTHEVTNAKTFDSVSGWVPASGDGRDIVKETRFDVVDTNSCRNSAWVGVGPTDPACLKQKEKKEADALAKTYSNMLPGLMSPSDHQTSSLMAAKIVAGEDAAMALYYRKLADDPPMAYTKVAKASQVRLRGYSSIPASLHTFRTVIGDVASAAGDTAALATTINRANGAFAATPRDPGADAWTQRQNDAAAKYASAALGRFQDATDSVGGLRGDLVAAGFPARIATALAGRERRALNASVTLFKRIAWGG